MEWLGVELEPCRWMTGRFFGTPGTLLLLQEAKNRAVTRRRSWETCRCMSGEGAGEE